MSILRWLCVVRMPDSGGGLVSWNPCPPRRWNHFRWLPWRISGTRRNAGSTRLGLQTVSDTETVTNSIVIRSCNGPEELTACVDLQIEVWGYTQRDVIPQREFIVIQRIGGQVFGAYDPAIPAS